MKCLFRLVLFLLCARPGVCAEPEPVVPPPQSEICNPQSEIPQEELPSCEGEDPDSKPLWEAGIFGGVGVIPQYRGSDEYDVYGFPIPYLVYRGKRIRSDREGVRGIFLETQRLETNVSFSGNPPVEDDAEIREGMPDLDPMVQAGPSLRIFILPKENRDRLYGIMAVRAAMSVDAFDSWEPDYQGVEGEAGMFYSNETLLESIRFRFGMSAAVRFGSSAYYGYYYDVPRHLETPQRSRFDGEGGYGGIGLSVNAVKEWAKWFSTGVYARWDNVDGSSFDESPMVQERNNVVLGCVLVFKLAKSKTNTISFDEDKE